MLFNKIDRHEYELMELEEKDLEAFKQIRNILDPENLPIKTDNIILEHTLKTMLSTYIGNIVLNKEISFDPVDGSVKLYLSKEHVSILCPITKSGMVVFVSKIASTDESLSKNLSGWYDEDIFLNKH